MSHFSVLVVGADVEKQLAPFQENNMGDCPKEYIEFIDKTDEIAKGYEAKLCASDGADFKAEYPTIEAYAEDYHGYKKDEVLGRYGYWENPNAKWDWYRIGGRWAGHFKLKAGVTAPAPRPGYEVAFGQEQPADNTADTATKSEIDFEKMREDAAHDAALEYDYVAGIFGDLPAHKPWAEFSDIENIEERRAAYRVQPRIMAWHEAGKIPLHERRKLPVDLTFGNPDDYVASRDHFINLARLRAGSTFAVLLNGKWYERGEMGWWACVSNEKDTETWLSMFHKMLDELPGDTQLTVVDCHI